MNLSKNKSKVLFINYYNYRSEQAEDTDQRIIRYLHDKVKRIVHIVHPFPEFGSRFSYLTIYENGKKLRQLKFYVVKGPGWLQFLIHILITYFFLFRTGFTFDLCIAAANLKVIAILPLRLVRPIKRLIYYSVDFVPQRFHNPLLNWSYHFLSKLACKYSDTNWVMTKEQIEQNRLIGINNTNSAPFSLVPIGYETKNIDILPAERVDFYNLVYAGALREAYGPQLALKAIPSLIKKIPKIRLTLIGVGKYENELKKIIKILKINKYIDFKGYIPNFKDLTDTLATKSIGLAPYKPIPGSFSFYSDPSKIKLYMCCGLPVITTNVSTMTNLIAKTKSGIIIDYSAESLSKAVTSLLSNQQRYKLYKDAAIKLSKKFGINRIMDIAIKKIPA